jgi:hypothetical protein
MTHKVRNLSVGIGITIWALTLMLPVFGQATDYSANHNMNKNTAGKGAKQNLVSYEFKQVAPNILKAVPVNKNARTQKKSKYANFIDTNGDGKLDAQERKQALKYIEEFRESKMQYINSLPHTTPGAPASANDSNNGQINN